MKEVGDSRKNKWIDELKQKGLIPLVEVLDEIYNNELANEFEYYWILQCRAWGFDLVNSKNIISKYLHKINTKKPKLGCVIKNDNEIFRKCEKIISELIKTRKDAKFTQQFMAKWLGVSRKKLNEFENGCFDFELMVNYADKLSIDIELTMNY